MGTIYVNEAEDSKKNQNQGQSQRQNDKITFSQDLKNVGLGFVGAAKEAGNNILSTFGITSLSNEEDENNNSLRKVIRNKFTPLTSFVFMVFTLLYMPCIVTGIAMKQEFGTWKWFGVATAMGLSIAWTLSFIIYNIGLWVL